jgi:glycosyltransferase involved in cell wall biosynthesis
MAAGGTDDMTPELRRPLVSVCIPTCNRATMLRGCIASVLSQTLPDFELIVSDNASNDETCAVVNSFADGRIRYFRNERNIGMRANWQQCLSLARGEYVTILPDDDLMLPDNLQCKAALLTANPAVGMVHSKFHVIDRDGNTIKLDSNYMHGLDRACDAIECKNQLLSANANTINAATVMFRRECYHRLGGFSERLDFAIDWEYWMRIAVYYDVAFIAKPLTAWRIHHEACSTRNLGSSKFLKYREDMKAKKSIADCYVKALPGSHQLRKQIWQQMADRLANNMDIVIANGGKRFTVLCFCIEMCLRYPMLLLSRRVCKIFLKTLLSHKAVMVLKGSER